MSLWESIDDMGKEIEHRGLKIRQMSHDILFHGLTGDDPCRTDVFSMEPYNINDNKIITDVILDCIKVRREYGTPRKG